jgi:hypothetical protein
MAKNDGWAEVHEQKLASVINKYIKHRRGQVALDGGYRKDTEQLLVNWQVIINHFEDEPEIWDKFETEQEAREEMVLWNTGNFGEGFTYSAEWLKKQAEENKG